MSTSLSSISPRRGAVGLAMLLLATANAMAQPAVPPPVTPVASRPDAPRLAPPPPLPPGAAAPRAKLRHQRPAADVGIAATASGRVARWLQNPNGDVDGLLLQDGTQVTLPPMQSARLLQGVKLGDTVQFTGTRSGESGPAGTAAPRVLRATQVRTAAGATLALADAEPGNAAPVPPPREPSALTPMNATGRIATLLYGDRGNVNGVLLADGTAVRFPPHVGADMAQDLKVGSTLYARGYGTRNNQGTAFEATRLGSSEATARDVFSPLAHAGGPEAPRRGPAGAGGNPPAPPVPPTAPGASAPR